MPTKIKEGIYCQLFLKFLLPRNLFLGLNYKLLGLCEKSINRKPYIHIYALNNVNLMKQPQNKEYQTRKHAVRVVLFLDLGEY
jgi:hypothetical protein